MRNLCRATGIEFIIPNRTPVKKIKVLPLPRSAIPISSAHFSEFCRSPSLAKSSYAQIVSSAGICTVQHWGSPLVPSTCVRYSWCRIRSHVCPAA